MVSFFTPPDRRFFVAANNFLCYFIITMKYQIITFGCQMNESDSERLGQYLDSRGWSQARDVSEADLVFFNACSVRQSAVDRLYAKVKKIKSADKKARIILIGCILQKDKNKFTNLGVKIRRIEQLPINPASSHPELVSGSTKRATQILKRVQNDSAYYVPIMRGCNNWCSYCAVPLTKGRERCRPAREIINEIKTLVAARHQEIALLGQNVNSYFGSQGTNNPQLINSLTREPNNHITQIDFADLLKIINKIPGNFKIRFLTNHPKDMSDKLIRTIAQCDKVIKEIHLPFQSGDDSILKAMNRHYTKQHYLDLVKKIKLIIPGVKITTDIIVGFPNETETQFQETVDVVKKVGFFKAYISKYSPRQGTIASRLADNIPMAEKKRREQILRQII